MSRKFIKLIDYSQKNSRKKHENNLKISEIFLENLDFWRKFTHFPP